MVSQASCPDCGSTGISRNGFTRHGKQNHRCRDFGRQFVLTPVCKAVVLYSNDGCEAEPLPDGAFGARKPLHQRTTEGVCDRSRIENFRPGERREEQ